MSAILSACGLYRYRLERAVPLPDDDCSMPAAYYGRTLAFIGVNPSTADSVVNDSTVKKWIGFCKRWGVPKFIVGNVFAFRATDVRYLANAQDPVGPDNPSHLLGIVQDADIIVPCWGNRIKLPQRLRPQLDHTLRMLHAQGKPVMAFSLTNGGDPKHPLMLGYDTPLQPIALPTANDEAPGIPL